MKTDTVLPASNAHEDRVTLILGQNYFQMQTYIDGRFRETTWTISEETLNLARIALHRHAETSRVSPEEWANTVLRGWGLYP